MPLVKRAVEPVFVSRATLSSQIKNELEGVVVNTLAGLIKQLSSVSKHAENLFGDLVNEANGIYLRTVTLSGRVAGLQERIQNIDSGGREDSRIDEINARVFKSTNKEEQQILDRGTLPTALQEVYRSCSAPPNLSLLTPYRDDGKDGLKFYTDPEYFFALWVKEQTKQIEKKQKKKKGGRKKKESKKKVVKGVQRKQYAGVDKEFMEQTRHKDSPRDIVIGTPPTHRASTEINVQDSSPAAPPPPPPISHAQMAAPTAPPPPPPPAPPSMSAAGAPPPPPPPPPPGPSGSGFPPPPPPPPAPMATGESPQMPHYPPTQPQQTNYPQPPAPPPAPPMNFPAAPAPPPPPVMPAPTSAGPPPPPPPAVPSEPGVVGEIKKPPPEVDQRSALLLAIEKGMHLRKVEKKDDAKPSAAYGNDVASILKRRIAFEVSDTESDDEDTEDEGSDEWSD